MTTQGEDDDGGKWWVNDPMCNQPSAWTLDPLQQVADDGKVGQDPEEHENNHIQGQHPQFSDAKIVGVLH